MCSESTSPPVSVVLAVYNGMRFLPAQLESVLRQLQPTDELLVIDDASRDGSAQWIAARDDPRLKLHHNSHNLGAIRSFERGLALARHDIIFLCDQDDLWLTSKRDVVVAAFEQHPSALVVVSDARVVDVDGKITAPSFMATRGGFHGGLASTLWRNRYLGCAMAVRREVIAAALPLPPRVPMHDMWLGVVGNALGDVIYLPTPLLHYRRHDANTSPAQRQSWHRMLTWRVQLLLAFGQRLVSLQRHRRGLRHAQRHVG
jgi:glycosyltransferase involved in cell wall biosynthesis